MSVRALEAGIRYFSAEVLAENRTMLAMLPMLGGVDTERSGAIVDAHIEIAGPGLDDQAGLLNFMGACCPAGAIASLITADRQARSFNGGTDLGRSPGHVPPGSIIACRLAEGLPGQVQRLGYVGGVDGTAMTIMWLPTAGTASTCTNMGALEDHLACLA